MTEQQLSISFSGEASENFADRMDNMSGWYVRITTQDGEQVEASIVGSARDTEIDGDTWFDTVAFCPVDDAGMPIKDAEIRAVRVKDVYIY